MVPLSLSTAALNDIASRRPSSIGPAFPVLLCVKSHCYPAGRTPAVPLSLSASALHDTAILPAELRWSHFPCPPLRHCQIVFLRRYPAGGARVVKRWSCFPFLPLGQKLMPARRTRSIGPMFDFRLYVKWYSRRTPGVKIIFCHLSKLSQGQSWM